MPTTLLLDLLAPAPDRRDEAQRLVDFCLNEEIIGASLRMANPPRPGKVAAEARSVADLARKLSGAIEALCRDLTALVASPIGLTHFHLRSVGLGVVTGDALKRAGAPLAAAGEQAEAIAETLSALPSRGRPVTWVVRHLTVMKLLSVFRRFHVSRYPEDSLRWKAERNKFLHAALAARSMGCDRRALERHLVKIERDAASVVTGTVT